MFLLLCAFFFWHFFNPSGFILNVIFSETLNWFSSKYLAGFPKPSVNNSFLISLLCCIYYIKKNTCVCIMFQGCLFSFVDLFDACISTLVITCIILLQNNVLSVLVCLFFQIVAVLVVIVMVVVNSYWVQIMHQTLTHLIRRTTLSLFSCFTDEETEA